jgi:hypothetical protein
MPKIEKEQFWGKKMKTRVQIKKKENMKWKERKKSIWFSKCDKLIIKTRKKKKLKER